VPKAKGLEIGFRRAAFVEWLSSSGFRRTAFDQRPKRKITAATAVKIANKNKIKIKPIKKGQRSEKSKNKTKASIKKKKNKGVKNKKNKAKYENAPVEKRIKIIITTISLPVKKKL